MKTKVIVVLTALVAVALIAQAATSSSSRWIYGFVDSRAVWLSIGPTLAISPAGQLDVIFPPAPPPAPAAKQREYSVLLPYDEASESWILPEGASAGRSMSIYVNGLRYRQAGNWQLEAGGTRITALADNMLPEYEVTLDYDRAASPVND